MVGIDGIVGIVIFLFFVVWSFVFFYGTTSIEREDPMAGAKDVVSDNVVEYLVTDLYEIPVRYASQNNTSNSVFYFDYVWPSEGAKNSTKVYGNGSQLSCNITGDRLYWQADADEGNNYFTVKYSDENEVMNCTGGGLGTPINQTIPWSAVGHSVFSQDKADNMTSTIYSTFKKNLGILRDFRVEMNVSGSVTTYGPPTPNATSVYVKTNRYTTEDNNKAEIRVMVW